MKVIEMKSQTTNATDFKLPRLNQGGAESGGFCRTFETWFLVSKTICFVSCEVGDLLDLRLLLKL